MVTSANPPSIGNAATRSPAERPSASSRTMPATSLPGTNGSSGLIWYIPRVWSTSGNDTPAARTSILTPSPLGSSMSASCSDSGPPSSTIWIARMLGTIRAIVRGMSATAVNERLAALTAAGTSIWLDQLSRGLLETGELARMVEQESLQGVTSNPAIFEKSILGSADYDEDLKRLAGEGKSAREIYRATGLHDVRASIDILRPGYDRTNGVDGYVSWEVAPRLAHDTEGSLEQAHMYWELVDRPNLMIKIPATPEGIPAIEQALYDGMNINVTLLFKVGQYERVMEAFVRAMERRKEAGRPLDRHSVASFFVSRVDTEVDKRLAAAGNEELQGRAGLANARAAYQAFQRVFEGERFAALREAGCPVQRPLWASTGVKNPNYPPTLYVWGLVAPHTVNTMPMPTLEAAREQGGVEGATAAEDPSADLAALADAGIDMEDVTAQLLREGIDAFMVPMQKLLDGIEAKRTAIAA